MFGDENLADEAMAQLKDMLRTFSGDEEYPVLLATQYRKMFDALLEQGFERAEAIEILARQGGIKTT